MRFPDQESLICTCPIARLRRCENSILKSRSEAGVDLVVPAASNTPPSFPIWCHDLTTDLVRRRSFPSTRLEVQQASLTCCVILDLHKAVIVDGRVACDYANDRGSNLLPSVEFFSASYWTKL